MSMHCILQDNQEVPADYTGERDKQQAQSSDTAQQATSTANTVIIQVVPRPLCISSYTQDFGYKHTITFDGQHNHHGYGYTYILWDRKDLADMICSMNLSRKDLIQEDTVPNGYGRNCKVSVPIKSKVCSNLN